MTAQAKQFYGTWRLVSRTPEGVGPHETSEIPGKSPQGYLTYGRDGRMSVITIGPDRPRPADSAKLTDQERIALFNSTIAYAGTFTVEGGRVVHHIDISWNETWTGTSLARNFQFEGRRLTLQVDPWVGPDGEKQPGAVLVWEKVR